MNFGSTSLKLLEALPAPEPPRVKLLACRKIIRTLVDDLPNEATTRLCQKLRAVLGSVKNDPNSTAEERQQTILLLGEIKTVDPRRLKDLRKKGRAEVDLTAICLSDSNGADTDEESSGDCWDQDRLPLGEIYRISGLTIGAGGDTKRLVEAVLGKRPATIPKLQRLLFHLRRSLGDAGRPDPLRTVVEAILKQNDALPEQESYGTKLMAELRERCPD